MPTIYSVPLSRTEYLPFVEGDGETYISFRFATGQNPQQTRVRRKSWMAVHNPALITNCGASINVSMVVFGGVCVRRAYDLR